jgi:hypothetical protein
MKATARAAKQAYDREIFSAWHTAVFALSGYSGKLKSLDKYLNVKPIKKGQTTDEMLAALKAYQASGVSMNIKRLH